MLRCDKRRRHTNVMSPRMKLLKEFTSTSDAEALVERLRAEGVLTHLSSTNSKQLGAIATGAVKVGVWAVLNEQVNDAVALVANNKHVVEFALTEEEMLHLESQAKESVAGPVNSVLIKLAVAFAAIIIMVVAYNVLSNS